MIKKAKIDNNYIVIFSSCDSQNLKKMLRSKRFLNIIYDCDNDVSIDNYIVKLLHNVGIPSDILGYKYIKEILLYLYAHEMDCSVCKIYKIFSEKYKVKRCNIERNVNHAIETGYLRGNIDYLDNLFGYSIEPERGKPTNKEFLSTLLEVINSEYKKY